MSTSPTSTGQNRSTASGDWLEEQHQGPGRHFANQDQRAEFATVDVLTPAERPTVHAGDQAVPDPEAVGDAAFIDVRYNPEGGVDKTFSGDGLAGFDMIARAEDLSVQPDGKVLLAGGVSSFMSDGRIVAAGGGFPTVVGRYTPAARPTRASPPARWLRASWERMSAGSRWNPAARSSSPEGTDVTSR